MANRVESYQVQEIIGSTNLTDIDIESFITSANIIVNSNLSGSGLSDTVLIEIEKWLSAHLIKSTREREPQEIEIGDAREKYGSFGKYGSIGEGLSTTSYGRMVTVLDTTGKLKRIGKTKTGIYAVPEFDDSELL